MDNWAVAISANAGSTFAIRSDGALFTWGQGTSGQLASGATTSRSSPVQVGSSSWTTVSSGGNSFNGFAVRSDGTLWSWGIGTSGSLGDGTISAKSSPVQIGIGEGSWTAVSAGTNGARAISTGGVYWAWGINTGGQVGDSTLTNRSFAIAVGNSIADGSISSPVQVGSSSWTAVSSGYTHAAAIRSDGKLFTWGTGFLGSLGDGTIVAKSSPVQIGTSSWTSVSAGMWGGAAIRAGGALFTWGYNGTGQLGDGTIIDKSSPVQIGTSSWTSVSAGQEHMAAIRSDKILFTWGNNNYTENFQTAGALGDGTVVSKSSPVQIGTSSWTLVSAGKYYTLGIS